jgi:phosphoribosylaminoimidazolecarboxamide formyltransferase / IMP cyclohydrolase
MIKRALVSVYDKTGVVAFASALAGMGIEIVSSGGTSAALAVAGVPHLQVDEVTGFPEMLDGRVKTLHPHIHGAILADRSKPDHLETLREHSITPIDLVVCNLYPFLNQPSIELIDIGGPSMVRSAAKNHESVGVVVDPADYEEILAEIRHSGSQSLSSLTMKRLAAKAFYHTSTYDLAIADWMDGFDGDDATSVPADQVLPEVIHLDLRRAETLRYGENPHQVGARYTIRGQSSWADTAIQHSGKAMSYLNVYDTDAAWRLVHELHDGPAAVVIKHANPCGAAVGADVETAYRKAHAGDPVSAFGGVIAVNRTVTVALAEHIAGVFTEVLIAPSYEADALELLRERKAMRVLESEPPSHQVRHVRSIDGGVLVQSPDRADAAMESREGWRVVSKVSPDEMMWRDLDLAWRVCAHVSSNAIVIATEGSAVGIGGGQQSRLDSARLAVGKAGDRARGAVAASDAFFPFRDGLDTLAEAGVRAIIQTGGSVRDDEVIAAADEYGIALVLTGVRHFRH